MSEKVNLQNVNFSSRPPTEASGQASSSSVRSGAAIDIIVKSAPKVLAFTVLASQPSISANRSARDNYYTRSESLNSGEWLLSPEITTPKLIDLVCCENIMA
jgi:hypothetical protein